MFVANDGFAKVGRQVKGHDAFDFRERQRRVVMLAVIKWRVRDRADKQIVFVICPGCGTEYRLDHEISHEGVVSPSLECPDSDCGFHDTVILVGWRGDAVEKSGD